MELAYLEKRSVVASIVDQDDLGLGLKSIKNRTDPAIGLLEALLLVINREDD
jgi:hypothetical protein